ncbi:Rid family hydrolase [Spartinivicinus ruber]|uniref:Rid family hydrolase n=1 Tax=Spartinivicinus ruber TaxID=2683272 RepID=UPI0013D56859|nr:Rid family hydrolase [Spartinivicinus ruber]
MQQKTSYTLSKIKRVKSNQLSVPLPVFTHASIFNDIIYTSCIQGFKPGHLEPISQEASDQAKQIMENLSLLLEESGSNLSNIIKMTLFFTNLDDDFQSVNQVINSYFPTDAPARSSLGVSHLPKDCKIVIECMAAAAKDNTL